MVNENCKIKMKSSNETFRITEKHLQSITQNCGFKNEEITIEKYDVFKASDKLLGFLSDYWKLKIQLFENRRKHRHFLSFFIKGISVSNEAKAKMVKNWKLFENELFFYSIIRRKLETPGVKPWSASLITVLDEAMVFQDLNAMKYKTRNKLDRFDNNHTLQALKTLARFHASSIIFKRRQLISSIYDEVGKYLAKGGYQMSDPWFVQCMDGALEAVRLFSKYRNDKEIMDCIENRWSEIWHSALKQRSFSSRHCQVICHRDLWNNNILFHYEETNDNNITPDDCLLVDFQAVGYQEPAADVMFLLYSNLDQTYRKDNMQRFLDYYYRELEIILLKHDIVISEIITKDEFLVSAEEHKLWGLITCACLTPQFWLDDDITSKTFCDMDQFNQILLRDKGKFIKEVMFTNQDYKNTVLSIFEEIIEVYCLK